MKLRGALKQGYLAACRSRETPLYVPPRRPNCLEELRFDARPNTANLLVLCD